MIDHPGTITFFNDPRHPLVEPAAVTPDDLLRSIVGRVDLGLSIALIEFAEETAESHRRMAVRAFRIASEEIGEFHVQRASAWDHVRAEALAAYESIARIRAN